MAKLDPAALPSEEDAPETAPDDRVVRWMPIVVPLLALLLFFVVVLIDAEVF
jgi:hypothetical protein